MKKLIPVLILLLVAVASCNLTGRTTQEIYTYDEILQSLIDIDTKHDTSLWNESFKNRLPAEKIPEVYQDVLDLQAKLANATSRSEKEYKSITNLVESRLHLLDSQEAYSTYVTTAKGASCDDPPRMHRALREFERAINESTTATHYWDTALNTYKPALEELAKQRERPAFTAMPMWKYWQDLREYKSILQSYCPLDPADKPDCIEVSPGVCAIIGESLPDDPSDQSI